MSNRKSLTEETLQDFVEYMLDDYMFEELLEEFDITPGEAFYQLYINGLVDEEIMKKMMVVK
jgi:hypothetical protein